MRRRGRPGSADRFRVMVHRVAGRRSGDAVVVAAVHDGVMTRQRQRREWMVAGGVLLVAGVAVQTLDDADNQVGGDVEFDR
ncbi:hypothetical protein GCM10010112_77010 [Actinoplanes lobatus]|uniref:Uncharacterized protein n=2 Tax=Actinoplanes lobatus TaxID=113568 RepID=A0ABQ4AS79_9ACTN|nr:hypothetical protein GCM10010112_77010 [Actinoplanes lobatus]GIE43871.1 hypothetical protein Alo02nite_67690 [Actinoplanes lobatus]